MLYNLQLTNHEPEVSGKVVLHKNKLSLKLRSNRCAAVAAATGIGFNDLQLRVVGVNTHFLFKENTVDLIQKVYSFKSCSNQVYA